MNVWPHSGSMELVLLKLLVLRSTCRRPVAYMHVSTAFVSICAASTRALVIRQKGPEAQVQKSYKLRRKDAILRRVEHQRVGQLLRTSSSSE